MITSVVMTPDENPKPKVEAESSGSSHLHNLWTDGWLIIMVNSLILNREKVTLQSTGQRQGHQQIPSIFHSWDR